MDNSTKDLKKDPFVELVNPLVEKSFGEGFKGNYHFGIGGSVCESDKLGMIMKKRPLGIFGFRYAGHLGTYRTEHDGSSIVVLQRYGNEARKYAQLYKERTGRDVQIILADDIKQTLEGIIVSQTVKNINPLNPSQIS